MTTVTKVVIGRKGSGKTHYGVKKIVGLLEKGRRVVAVIPQIKRQAIVDHFGGDETILRQLVVVEYEAMFGAHFWPPEEDVRAKVPGAWCRNVVWTGDAVFLDEAGRLGKRENAAPPGFVVALSFARHWKGPKDYRHPGVWERVTDPSWYPNKPLEDGEESIPLVASNITLLAQGYGQIAGYIKDQTDEVTHLSKVDVRKLPKLAQEKAKGTYTVRTYPGNVLPRKPEEDENPPYKIVEKHEGWIHDLYEEDDEPAEESAVDDYGSIKNDPKAKSLRFQAIIAVLLILGAGGYVWHWWSGFQREQVEQKAKLERDQKAKAVKAREVAAKQHEERQMAEDRGGPKLQRSGAVRVVGTVGSTLMVIGADGNMKPAERGAFTATEEGFYGSVDGVKASRWSAPILVGDGGGDRDDRRNVQRGGRGVSGPGSDFAGDLAGRFAGAGGGEGQ